MCLRLRRLSSGLWRREGHWRKAAELGEVARTKTRTEIKFPQLEIQAKITYLLYSKFKGYP